MSSTMLRILAVSAWLPVLAANAQTVDYTNAEQMFGEPVTVSVTGKPQRASDAPANITILTADDLRRSGATDIPSALRFVPGLDVRRYGQFHSAVGIRGYNTAFNPRVLVLVDGRQVYNDDYGYTVWSLIPVTLAEIRQIEIIRGPNAALYGFNAVSGVINIVTFDPLRDRKSSVSAVGGTQHQIYGEGVATLQPSDRVGMRVSAKGQKADEFDGPGFLGSIERPQVRTGAADLRARLTDDVQLDLSASLGKLDANYYIDIGTYLANHVDTGSLRAVVTANTAVGLVQFDAYHNMLDEVGTIPGLTNSWDQAVTVLRASDLVRLHPDHTVRIGAEYRHNAIVSEPNFGGRMTSDLLAASAMWNWQIVPAVSLTNAARIDSVSFERGGADTFFPGIGYPFGDRRIVEPSYNSALVYAPTDYDTFSLSTARALQLPSLFSYGNRTTYGPLNVLGSRELDPSAATNYEFGYQRKLPALLSSVSLSVFHQQTDKTIGSPFGSGPTFLPTGQIAMSARNFAGSEATGGEIGIEGSEASGWRWNLAYSLAQLNDKSPDAQLAQAPSVAYELQTPTHSVTAGLGYSWKGLEVDAMARWQSNFTDFYSDIASGRLSRVEIPDYVTVNARVGYRLGDGATVSLTAEQANAARQTTAAGRQTERRVLAGLKLEF